MTANMPEPVREALSRFDDLIGAHGNKPDADALTTLETEFAALTARVAILSAALESKQTLLASCETALQQAWEKAEAHARDAAADMAELDYWRRVQPPNYRSQVDGLSHRERIAAIRDQFRNRTP